MRAGSIMVVVLLLAACAGAPTSPLPAAPTGPPEPTAAVTPVASAAPSAPPESRILATDLWGDFASPFSVAAATDADEYETLWGQVGLQIPQPEVDFEHEIVLFLGMAGSSSCPEQFAGLVVGDDGRVYAEWEQAPVGQPCTDDLAPQGLLVAVLRSELPSEPFQFSLREAPVCPDCAEQPDRMVVDPR